MVLGLAARGDLVHRVRALDAQLPVRRDAVDLEQDLLDLRRVDVDAAQDEHVVAGPEHRAHAPQRPPARARRFGQRRDVGRAVASERQPLLGQGGQDELARPLAVDRLLTRRIDDLGREVSSVDVRAARRVLALGRHAGPTISDSP